MVNEITWEELTLVRLQDAKDKQLHDLSSIERHKTAIEQLKQEVDRRKEYIAILEKALELSKKDISVTPGGDEIINAELMLKQSTWDNLSAIMNANKGLLVAQDAVTILVKANVFKDREQARNTIYSTLYHHKSELQKVRQGVYKLLGEVTNKPNILPKAKNKIKRKRTHTPGLLDAITKLKIESPAITKEEVRDSLVNSGFPFQGKNPGRSVNMAWNHLGYVKDSIPIINAQPDLFAITST
jgi:hypothetical protein